MSSRSTADLEMETQSEQTEHGFRDKDGFIGPYEPGNGPRSDPRGEFPTGPDVGQAMPNVLSQDSSGQPFDLHKFTNGEPYLFVFFRSAVW